MEKVILLSDFRCDNRLFAEGNRTPHQKILPEKMMVHLLCGVIAEMIDNVNQNAYN